MKGTHLSVHAGDSTHLRHLDNRGLPTSIFDSCFDGISAVDLIFPHRNHLRYTSSSMVNENSLLWKKLACSSGSSCVPLEFGNDAGRLA